MHAHQPSFADGFGDVPPEVLSAPSSGGRGADAGPAGIAAIATSAPTDSELGGAGSQPDTPTLGRPGGHAAQPVFSPVHSEDADASRAARPPPGPVGEAAEGSASEGHQTARSGASGDMSARAAAEIMSDASFHSGVVPHGHSYAPPADEGHGNLSMHTHPVQRGPRPPAISLPAPSEAGSLAAASIMYTPGHHMDGPIAAVTNDINVVEADQHWQEQDASEMPRSELTTSLRGPDGGRPPVSSAPAKWWLTQVDGKAVERAEPHNDWWYDREAILSRKPSVRFRRSVDIQVPFYNEQVWSSCPTPALRCACLHIACTWAAGRGRGAAVCRGNCSASTRRRSRCKSTSSSSPTCP